MNPPRTIYEKSFPGRSIGGPRLIVCVCGCTRSLPETVHPDRREPVDLPYPPRPKRAVEMTQRERFLASHRACFGGLLTVAEVRRAV
jgi:hypothetical protein